MVHEAVQSCHSYSWQLTAIYVPAIGAGIYMLAKGEAGAFLSIVMGVLLIGLTLYWYFNQVALDRFNEARYELLEKLEKELFTGDCEWMSYYSALARRKRSWYTEFKFLRTLILAVYMLTIGLVVWANVSSERPEREGREISAAAMDSVIPKQAANRTLCGRLFETPVRHRSVLKGRITHVFTQGTITYLDTYHNSRLSNQAG